MAVPSECLLLILAACFFSEVVGPVQKQADHTVDLGSLMEKLNPGITKEREEAARKAKLDEDERKKKQEAAHEEFLKAVPHVLACFNSIGGPCVDTDATRKKFLEQSCGKGPLSSDQPVITCVIQGMMKAKDQCLASGSFNEFDALTEAWTKTMCEADVGLNQQPSPPENMDKDLCNRIKTAISSPSNPPKPKGASKLFGLADAKAKFVRECAEAKKLSKHADCPKLPK